MYKYYIYIFFLLLFFGINILSYIGIDDKLFYALLLALSVPFICKNKKQLTTNKAFIYLLVITVIYSVFKLLTDTGEGTRQAVLQIICAPLFYAACPPIESVGNKSYISLWRILVVIFFSFYIAETSIAILERLQGHVFWGMKEGVLYTIEDISNTQFRSFSIHGHPLQNALIVSTIMTFILVSPLKIKYKYLLWFLGYLAILCFNTRSSIVGNAALFGTYLLYTLFLDKKESLARKKRMAIVSIFIICAGLFLIFYLGMGGRLLDMGLLDDSSAQVRIDIWSVFHYFSLDNFLWGIDLVQTRLILYQSGLLVTENFWLDWLFKFGLVFLIPFVTLYFLFIKKLYKNYSLFKSLFTGLGFLLIASTNNSLSALFIPLYVFLISIRIFDINSIYKIIPNKYLIPKQE